MTLYIGYIAAILTATTMVPQIIQSLKTKQVQDVSLVMLLLYTFNTGLWVVYGLSIDANPIVLADGIACGIGLTQLFLKFHYQS